MFEVWQNLAPFGGRPIGGAVEALLTKVEKRRSPLSPIVAVFVAAAVMLRNNMTKRLDTTLTVFLPFVVPLSLVRPRPGPLALFALAALL
jgi:hypothetical protein